MANRHLSRSIVMQSLFEWDFNGNKDRAIEDIVTRNAAEFAPGVKDISFMKALAKGILEKQGKIDAIITKAAPDWPLEKISTADRNVLRIGLYELLFEDRKEVPPKVAINEAIELAKTFGGENSGKFVNGVLGAVYKELGEPGKDESSQKKNKTIDPATLPIDKLIGALVFAREGRDVYLGLIHDVFGHWTLSKGHLKEDEEEKDGVVRKVKEEMGAVVSKVHDTLGSNEYIASDPKQGKIKKRVSYFLAEAKFDDLTAGESGGIDDAQWFKLADVVNLNIYDDILPIVTKGIHILLTKK
ncbi:MAG: transcription antitermination factor NusB [Candidatus Yonathbacteria bacterium]|nr:transcription antitermination factor NusB [Candidatus Yonathbacteria bacterium]